MLGDNAKERLRQRFLKGLQIVIQAMKEEFIAQGHNASGKTLDSFEANVYEDAGSYVGEVLANKSASFVDSGTRPHRPPFKAIFDWSQYVLKGASIEERTSFSFAVIRKIERFGTPTPNSYSFSSNGRRKDFSSESVKKSFARFEETIDLFQFTLDLLSESFVPQKTAA